MEGHISTHFENGITTIEFFHPAQNSMPGHLLAKLADAITVAGKDDRTIIIVLKSAGDRTFCAGASFTELEAIQDFENGKTFFMGFAGVINAMRKCPKMIIGRIQGKAVGGGVGLASACDYCMGTKFALVRLSELAVGIGPFVIGPIVERKIGLSAFSQMAINADEWQTAEWAKQKGLFTESFESVQELDDQINKFTNNLIKKSPEALRLLKKVFWEGTDHWDTLLEQRAEMSGKLILSDFAKDAIKSFLNA